MPARRTLGPLLALALAFALALPAPAGAATRIGNQLTEAPDSGIGCPGGGRCTVSSLLPGGAYASPIEGIVVRWRIRTDGDGAGADVNLRVLHPGSVAGTYAGGSASSNFDMPGEAGTYAVPTRLPINPGDVIGIDAPMDALNISPGPNAAYEMVFWAPVLAEGGTALAPGFSTGWELLINADIERDADHDGFGDESQDACPTLGSTQGACPISRPPKKCQRQRKGRRRHGKKRAVEAARRKKPKKPKKKICKPKKKKQKQKGKRKPQ